MPSIYTHNYFAKDVYTKISKEKIYQINDTKYYLIFAQSFDNLFYYNFLSLKPGGKIRDLGYHAQTHKVWKYFKNMIEYIKENKLYDDANLGYLYGSLTHYALDSTCHPYIHYISGRYTSLDKKNTRKYIGYHTINELMIDALYYEKNHKEPFHKYKIHKDLIPKVTFPDDLKKCIDYTFKETFDVDNLGKIYNKSYNQSYYIYKLLVMDRTSIKKKLYKLFDFITPFKDFKAYTYSNYVGKLNYSVLNNEHNKWLHPVTGEEHTESFEDLYNIAFKTVVKNIKKCNDYFNDKCSLEELKKTIGNISYSSGLDSSTRAVFKYFKF